MKDIHARDVMQADVISVSPETPLLEVHRLFLEEEINGAPVVDEDGDVVGVISSMDLLRAVLDEYDTGAAGTAPAYFREELPYSGPDWIRVPEDFQDRMKDLIAERVMIREIVKVAPDTPITEVAQIMRKQRIHRVLVVDDAELLGILTTFDLIGVIERAAPRPLPPIPRQAGDPVC